MTIRATARTQGALARGASKSERTRVRILDAAALCFQRRGFAAVTLKDIAAAAEMQAGSLYYHFDTKEALVEAVLTAGVDGAVTATRDAVDRLGAAADPTVRLRAALVAHLRVVLSDSAYAAANLRILGQVPAAIRERHLKRQRKYGAFWRDLFQHAADIGAIREDLDLSVTRMLALGALNWSIEWYRTGRRSPDQIAEHAATMILDGVRSRPAAPPRRRRLVTARGRGGRAPSR